MDIEFKEKTFEKYFGHELARITKITFSPDQCDEAFLGFDEAFFLPEEWFFRFGPYVRRRRRGRFTGLSADEFNRRGKLIAAQLPKFRFNLFVQFKRPTFLTSSGAKQWPDWRQCYYRYQITPHQQEALERIDAQSLGRAATIYASPAFWKSEHLWQHVEHGAIVEQSNIANAGKLKGHGHYGYIEPGHFGKGHSETADIESEPLRKLINGGLEQNEPLPLNQHVKKVAAAIMEATSNSDSLMPLFRQVQTTMGLLEYDPDSLYDALATIEAFSDAFGMRFYAIA